MSLDADEQKRAAGRAAAALVQPDAVVGLGTGSTAAHFVRALGERVAGGLRIVGVPTSEATAALARELSIPLTTLDEAGRLDLTVDGADEIGPALTLIKGGGGALLREKLVWEASERRVVIAEAAKDVERLGRFPLPVEVVPFGHQSTARRIAAVALEHGAEGAPVLRLRGGAPFVTDGGALIYDVSCGVIADPHALGAALKAVTGVVEHGLFLNLADEALIGGPDGVYRRTA